MSSAHPLSPQSSSQWLQAYYFLRAGISVGWIALAVLLGPGIGAALLIAYPAWDALANLLDARRNGGLGRNPTQMLNVVVSVGTAVAIAWALTLGMAATLNVFGAWAILSGLLQLATAVRRWKRESGQWVMILSGAQSAAAGAFFLKLASSGIPLDVTTVAPYAALGAVYFLISAIWLTVRNARQRSKVRTG